jgi:hypothetical protein
MSSDCLSVNINFLVPYKDIHLISQDYEITREVLKTWTLGRIKVPLFSSVDEMKSWILSLDFLINKERIILLGPEYPFNKHWPVSDSGYNTYLQKISFEDNNEIVYHLPQRDFVSRKTIPIDLLDTQKLFDFLKEEKSAWLPVDRYGSYSDSGQENGKYFFESVAVTGLIDFITANSEIKYTIPKQYTVFESVNTDYIIEEDFNQNDAFWEFKNIGDSNYVYIVEVKQPQNKIEDLQDFFNAAKIWHERFIYGNMMYFIAFQTDDIDSQNFEDYFNFLTAQLSKRYPVTGRTLSVSSYLEMKRKFRNDV